MLQRLQNKTFGDLEKLGFSPPSEFLFDQVCLEQVNFPRAANRGLAEKDVVACNA
jgi:hypothetical protein